MFWSSFDGVKWSAEEQGVGVGTSNGPSLALFNGNLYAAWKGIPTDTRMFWSSFDGTKWSPEQEGVGIGASNGPSLEFNGMLYAAWKGVPNDARMFFSPCFEGTNWAPGETRGRRRLKRRPGARGVSGKAVRGLEGVAGDSRTFPRVLALNYYGETRLIETRTK